MTDGLPEYRNMLKDKVVVITGATRGIGKELAKAFAAYNANLALCSGKQPDPGLFGSAIASDAAKVLLQKCDVGNHAEVENFIRAVYEKFGKIDIVINNAGIGVFDNIDQFGIKEWEKVININVNGCFYICREAIPLMKKNRCAPRGYIINMGSLSHNTLVDGNAAYSASKAALKTFSDHLFSELRAYNILVSYLAVGSVNTAFSKRNPDTTGWKIRPEEIAHITLQMVTDSFKDSNSCITYSEIRTKYPVKTESYKE